MTESPILMPGRQCRCAGDGATWADTSMCPVHTVETSPLARAVSEEYERGRVASLESMIPVLQAEIERLREWINTAGRNCPSQHAIDEFLGFTK